MRPFEQADYKKKHPNFEPVRIKPKHITFKTKMSSIYA